MSIIMYDLKNGELAPGILCDHCNERIDSSAPGLVMFREPGMAPLFYAHVGYCNYALVPGQIRTRPLDQYLEQLTYNVTDAIPEEEIRGVWR